MEGEQSRGVFMALAQKRRLSYLHAFYWLLQVRCMAIQENKASGTCSLSCFPRTKGNYFDKRLAVSASTGHEKGIHVKCN